MNDQQCDIHDVTRAAADLVALGCTLGATHFYDSVIQIQFGSVISNYVNEVISNVNDGVISAWDGVQEIVSEHAELWSRGAFYIKNGMGVAAGAIQVEAGVTVIGGSGGWALPYGGMLIAHGGNNIYEGFGNIYNGPDSEPVQGPLRQAYQALLEDEHKGDVFYGSMDLFLSGGSMLRLVRKPGSVQLFKHDSINYERAYVQYGKMALFFEGLVDAITLSSMLGEDGDK